MKKIVYLLLLLPVLAFGQSPEQNYVRTTVYKEATTTSNPTKAVATVTYVDGLGRPIQQVAGKMTPDGKDIITHIEYDNFGRQIKDYLPYPAATSNLTFDTSAHDNTISYYTTAYGDASPFSEKIFESSPLNRVLKQGASGTPWQPAATGNDHTVKIAYQTNGEAEVKKIKADAVWNPVQKIYEITLVNQGEYAAAQLYKTITKDENWTSGNNNTTEEFKNKEGQLVLKVTYNAGVAHRIYYVYDQFGNLTYVIPPLAADELGGAMDL